MFLLQTRNLIGCVKTVIRLADDWFGLADRLVDNPSSDLSSSPYRANTVCVTAKLEDMADFFTYLIYITK